MDDLVAGEECPQVLDLALQCDEGHGTQTEREAPGETGAHRDDDTSGCECRQRTQSGSRGHRCPKAGHHDTDTKSDPRCALSSEGERHERIVVEQRRVVAPRTIKAQFLGQGNVSGCVTHGGEERRQVHTASVPTSGVGSWYTTTSRKLRRPMVSTNVAMTAATPENTAMVAVNPIARERYPRPTLGTVPA